mmetsp:Transcript_8339/g.17734  ORF Transcript_8339/g.17734 Transcript_8339/m.17734 type:complete len:284 (+) Transcript_8339:1039-1890(+)
MLEGLFHLHGDLPPHVLVAEDPLHQTVHLVVGGELLYLALVVQGRLGPLVAPGMVGLPRDVQPLRPGGRHIQHVLGLRARSGGGGGVGLGHPLALALVVVREGLGLDHDVLKIPRIEQFKLNILGWHLLHVDPQVLVVPEQVNPDVGAALHVVHAARGRLDPNVLGNLALALAQQHPAMNSLVHTLIFVRGRVVVGVRPHRLLLPLADLLRLLLLLLALVLGLQWRLLGDRKLHVRVLVVGCGRGPGLLLKKRALGPGLVPRGNEPRGEAGNAIGVVAHTNEK